MNKPDTYKDCILRYLFLMFLFRADQILGTDHHIFLRGQLILTLVHHDGIGRMKVGLQENMPSDTDPGIIKFYQLAGSVGSALAICLVCRIVVLCGLGVYLPVISEFPDLFLI